MLGVKSDKEFDIKDYEEFYSHHKFVETQPEDAVNVHEIVPRFGWGFDMVEECKPKNLLDLGTLDGSFPLTIAKHFNIPVVGVDLTHDGIELANKRKEEDPRLDKLARFYQGTIEDWLMTIIKRKNKFDMVTAFEVIEHVKDPKVLLSLIDKVLSPNGNVLISTPSYESPLYGADDEKNKCHIRLYTTEDKNYTKANKYGTIREATSIKKEIGENRIKEIGVYSHLINVRYQ